MRRLRRRACVMLLTLPLDVDEVGVLPAAQKCGVGRKLMEYTIKAARMYHLPVILTAAPGESPEGMGTFCAGN